MRFRQKILALAVLSLAGAAHAGLSIVDARTLTGGPTTIRAINNAGAFTGAVDFGQGDQVFVHDANGLTNISQLLGDAGKPGLYTAAGWAINQAGTVVGHDSDLKAFVYAGGSASYLTLFGGANDVYRSVAYGINDGGTIVGSASGTGIRAFAQPGTGPTVDLGSLGGQSGGAFAQAINNGGVVVGSSSVQVSGRTTFHAFAHAGGVMTDLGTIGGYDGDSYARDINDAGQIVGESAVETGSFAFLYSGGVMKSLGTLGGGYSSAGAINEAGVVVGGAEGADGVLHAFVYTEAGGMVDLNSLLDPASGWELHAALDINDAGTIVGLGSYKGVRTSFILSGALPAPVPEPAAWTLTLLGLAASAAAVRAKRQRSPR